MATPPDLSRPLSCDAIVVGAGLAGLVAAAVLARNGRDVALVDRPSRVGGRGGATPHRGYWLDGGQRDGMDVTDLQVGWRWGQLAEREAGVEVTLREVEPTLRVHHLPDEAGAAARVLPGSWGAEGFGRLAVDALGCPADAVADFGEALAQLSGVDAERRRAAVPLPLAPWLDAHVARPEVRRALLTLVSVVFCERPEQASAGRLMASWRPEAATSCHRRGPATRTTPSAGACRA